MQKEDTLTIGRTDFVDRTPTHKTHLCSTVCSQACTAQPMRFAQELHCHLCAPTQVLSSGVTHVSSMVVLSRAFLHEHFLFFTYLLHPAHLQAPSVDKLRHQESLWREDLQSGGNPRTTTPTGYEPNELATISRIDAYSGDPYQSFDVQENSEKKITELPSREKW